jgi:hypothetical protein
LFATFSKNGKLLTRNLSLGKVIYEFRRYKEVSKIEDKPQVDVLKVLFQGLCGKHVLLV